MLVASLSSSSCGVSASLRVEACPQHGTSGSGTPWRTGYRNAKSPAFAEGRACDLRLKEYQPRVRERIMKLSKVYSATCHHRYWSERYACIASLDFLNSGFFADISAH